MHGSGCPEGHIWGIGKFLSTNLRLSFSPKLLIAYVTSLHADSPEVRFGVFFCNQGWDLLIAWVQGTSMGSVKASLRNRPVAVLEMYGPTAHCLLDAARKMARIWNSPKVH